MDLSPDSSPSQTEKMGVPKSLACKQCRARKVRCDRVETGCKPCSRRGVQCSYVAARDVWGGSGLEVDEGPEGELTQAGLKRRRIRRACVVCRSLKAKCSGDQPCGRCQCYSLQCTYSDNHGGNARRLSARLGTDSRGLGVDQVTPDDSHVAETPVCLPEIRETVGRHSDISTLEFDLDNDTIRQHLNTYFDKASNAGECIFLHKASVITDWHNGKLDPLLLKAICSLAAQLMSPQGNEHRQAVSWMKDVQTSLMSNLENQTVTYLQTMMIVIKFNYMCGNVRVTWMLLAMAARLALILQLNYEQPKRDPLSQEALRRLMWSIYLLDRAFCGGLEDLAVCPPNRLHIRLPSTDYAFHHSLASTSPFLNQPIPRDCVMRISNYYLKLMAIRDHILSYTKRIIRDGASPFESQGELRQLENELSLFREELPEELRLTPQRLIFMAYSQELSEYLMIHGTWFQCNCDLYRFLVPGIRESVPQGAIDATPAAYSKECQQRCLDNAVLQCDLWSRVYHLDDHQTVNIPIVAAYLYQCINIIDRLYTLLPISGENSCAVILSKLSDTLAFAHQIRDLYSPTPYTWVDRFIKACEHIFQNLGQQSFRQSPDRILDRGGHHVFSKFSFIEANRHLSVDTSDGEGALQSDPADSEGDYTPSRQHRPEEYTSNLSLEFDSIPDIYGQNFGFGQQFELENNYLAMMWSPFAVSHQSGQNFIQ